MGDVKRKRWYFGNEIMIQMNMCFPLYVMLLEDLGGKKVHW